ncbi:hypothetical protein FACS18945_5410 [Bacteroidia bacterium]|nr:hypothetical protein FACS18945_5410 [Bacteroidia bacterium]
MNTVFILSVVTVTLSFVGIIMIFILRGQCRQIARNARNQADILSKILMLIKSKSDVGTVIEHAEIIYQDLVQHLTPVVAELKIKLRTSDEHVLWRMLGGVLDEYSNNPFVLEQLRRNVKLDPNISRAVDNYIMRAEKLLDHLSASDPDGIIATAFAEGLLGQSITFFAQAKKLASGD